LMDETSRNKNNYFRYHLHKNEKKLPLMKRSYLFMKANRQRVYFYDCLCKLYLFLKK
ncbi:glycosyl transferase, partial [Klebsiella pneumoniae]|nr:glycosyl transferase [Klebsiella pneumoniae]